MDIYIRKRNGAYPSPENPQYPYLVLTLDNWNDYSYYTFFVVSLQRTVDPEDRIDLGGLRIMRRGQSKCEPTFPEETVWPITSEMLEGKYCSLAAQDAYYKTLHDLDDSEQAKQVLQALQDAAFLPDVRTAFQDEDCFKVSLLRDSDARRLLDEAGSMFGSSSNAIVKFRTSIFLQDASAPHAFEFDFGRDDELLSRRIHALVGLNGVGKTQVLARLAMLLSRFSKAAIREKRSTLETDDLLEPVPSIYNVVALSFSAFDEFDRPTEHQGEVFNYSYCGLRTQRGRLRSEEELLNDIKDLIAYQMDDDRREVLVKVLANLVHVEDLHSFVFDVEGQEKIYSKLSAGQRIVLNSLCHLLSKISPRTLVLFDEPELHLHPQLLTGMMTALREILASYNSYAIVATHSPIVIQELTRRCVHVVRRERIKPFVYNPTFETFGENLSEITRNVFVATDCDRDYRTTLEELFMNSQHSVEAVLELFDGKLGLNARIFLDSLTQ